jgi:hypothetical protein
MIAFIVKIVIDIVEKIIEFFAPKVVVKEIAKVSEIVKKKPVRKTRGRKKVVRRKSDGKT